MRRIFVAIAAAFLWVTTASGHTSPSFQMLPKEAFKPVVVPIEDYKLFPMHKEKIILPTPTVPARVQSRVVNPKILIAVGKATWYCKRGRSICHYLYPDRVGIADYYAAAGPALRVGNWRNSIVIVCSNNSCLRVKLIDWCQCYKDTSDERIIDLYYDAYKKLITTSTRVKVYR